MFSGSAQIFENLNRSQLNIIPYITRKKTEEYIHEVIPS